MTRPLPTSVTLALAAALLAGCQGTAPTQPAAAPQPAAAGASGWQPSILSEAAQQKILGEVKRYQQCLNDQTLAHLGDRADSRRVADLILQSCEGDLSAVNAALRSEGVPEPNANLYVRSKRSHGAQQVLRTVMTAQAQRSVGAPP